MSNEFDDDDALTEDSTSFDENGAGTNTLGDLWRNNPMVKVGIILAAGAAIFGAIILFGGDKEKSAPSMVQGANDVSSPPATEEVSEAYKQAIDEFNQTETETARATGGSVLPVPVSTPLERLEEPEENTTEEDPLQRWRALQQERLQNETTQRQTVETAAAPDTSAHDNTVQALAEIMSQQMQAILESQSQSTINYRPMTGPDWLEEQQAQAAAEAAAADTGEIEEEIEVLVPAGEIVYAQLITEANSDAPGPVLAQIASGPLTGSRILGDFQVQKELLTLNFTTVVIDGESIGVDGVALDPETTLPAMATDVDHHYFERIILPAAAAFVEGTAEAVADSGLTTVTIQGETVTESSSDASNDQEIASGIDEAGQELGDILDDMADDIEVTVRIESGTPLGILFLAPVTRPK